MTTVAEIISQAMIIIDDVRMQKELAVSPALFYRRYSFYVKMAMTLVTKPPVLYEYISSSYVEPEFTDYQWTSTAESVGTPTDINTGITGYELVSCTTLSPDGTVRRPYTNFTYNAETGVIRMATQSEAGVSYDFDFYNDGYFADLTLRMQRLMAYAMAIVWDERFSRNWLNMQPKIKDSAFETVNEANYMAQLTNRMTQNRLRFSDELRQYEQDYAYRNTVGALKSTDVFI